MSGNPNAPRIFLRGLATSREPKQTAEYRHRLVTAHQARCRIRSRARKPELQRFVPIRVYSWFKKHHPRSPFRAELGLESPSYRNSCPFVFIRGSKNITREEHSGQISGSKAQATEIRAHSCSFVVHSWFKKNTHARSPQHRSRARKPELQKFVLIRVHSWFKKHHSRGPFRAELGLETQSYKNSCLFVFIRGSKNTTRKVPSGQSSGSKPRATKIRIYSCSFVVQNNTTREVPSGQSSGSKPRATKIRVYSCPFVVQNNTSRRKIPPAGNISQIGQRRIGSQTGCQPTIWLTASLAQVSSVAQRRSSPEHTGCRWRPSKNRESH